jgi:hypothetical protein
MIDLHASKEASSSPNGLDPEPSRIRNNLKDPDQILSSWLNIFYLIVAKSVVNYIIFP